MDIKNARVTFHRNGVSGEPFHAVSFSHEHENLIATVTDEKGGCHVINPENLGMCYRGDNFERDLRDAIIKWYSGTYGVTLVRARDELNDGLTVKVF